MSSIKTQFKKGYTPWNKGIDSKEMIGWKGDKVGYRGKHRWVARKLGKPDTCEFCGKTGLMGHQVHWANKSREYKRNLTDWLRLCAKCHKKYDLKYAKPAGK